MHPAKILFMIVALAACQPVSAIADTPTPHPGLTSTLTDTVEPSEVAPAPCSFNWAEHDLEEPTLALLAAARADGLPITFGEDCIAAEGAVVYFAAMETNYLFTLLVEDPADKAEAGKSIEQVLNTLEDLDKREHPGVRPGLATLALVAGSTQLGLSFQLADGQAALASGLQCAPLYEALARPEWAKISSNVSL